MRGSVSAAGTAGILASPLFQVSRRTANTALPVMVISPFCNSSRCQCWVDRLVRDGRATISNAPSAIGPAKLTVSALGSPSRSGWFSAACSMTAAVAPPNGPIMFQ